MSYHHGDLYSIIGNVGTFFAIIWEMTYHFRSGLSIPYLKDFGLLDYPSSWEGFGIPDHIIQAIFGLTSV